MAKIFDYSCTEIYPYRDFNEKVIYSTICFKDKKICSFKQTLINGEVTTTINYESEITKEEIENIKNAAKSFYKNRVLKGNIESFFGDLMVFNFCEKEFKKNKKNGYPITILLRSRTDFVIERQKEWNKHIKNKLLNKYPEFIEIEHFISLDSFIIR